MAFTTMEGPLLEGSTCVEPLTVDTSLIWTLAFVPIVVILYKTTPELKTPLQSGQLIRWFPMVSAI